ncbi:MAG TPA: hypothetical protein VJV77_12250 [Casimicrobiaceae bacterium]|nr:hypothetical protein [Casimicrobiaceae bacterium]
MSCTLFRTARLCIAFLAATAFAPAAAATDFTDIWFIPQESGWGMNVVQSDSFLFATFFIYGQDKNPTWYTALLTFDGTRYAGGLYRTEGSFWASPWKPEEHPDAVQVGTASFQPGVDAYHATLAYAVDGVGSVSKQIVRQTLTRIVLGGSYVGGQAGSYSNCAESSQNGTYQDTFSLDVTHAVNGEAALTFAYKSGATCTLSGTLGQFGQLYDMPGATYTCTGNLVFTTSAAVYELKATAQGIEGRLAANLPSGCRESANFSAVLK